MFKFLTNIVDSSLTAHELVLHIGAGKCAELAEIMQLRAKHVHLVEAHPKLAEYLRQEVQDVETVSLHENLVLADKHTSPTFWLANNPRFSSHKPLSAELKTRFPNLDAEQILHPQSIAVNELIDALCISSSNNILILDVNGYEIELLEEISDLENKFQYVCLCTDVRNNEDAGESSVSEFMRRQGYERVFNHTVGETSRYQYWARSLANGFKQLQSKHEELLPLVASLQTENQKLQEKVKSAQSEKEELRATVTKTADENDSLRANTKLLEDIKLNQQQTTETLAEKIQHIATLEAKLEEKDKELARNHELAKGAVSKEALDSIVEQITKNHKQELSELQKKLDWRIDRGFNNSVKQVESFIGIQSFLENGSTGMDFHGWPISSDIALYLLGKIKSNNYDLIIEFGSGTSTQLFAKAIQQLSQQGVDRLASQQTKLIGDSGVENQQSGLVEVVHELPQRVLTFEHNKKYFEKTLNALKQSGLEGLVNLVHTPLVDCVVEKESYLYYSCDKSLAHIAELYEGRTAKILVLVDGPPGATGPLARLPAMSKLLNALANHQLEVVLDDYNRAEEKTIAERWKKMLDARFISYEEELVPCEKGAFVCRINP